MIPIFAAFCCGWTSAFGVASAVQGDLKSAYICFAGAAFVVALAWWLA